MDLLKTHGLDEENSFDHGLEARVGVNSNLNLKKYRNTDANISGRFQEGYMPLRVGTKSTESKL